jgi:hypothetical protein
MTVGRDYIKPHKDIERSILKDHAWHIAFWVVASIILIAIMIGV